MSEQSTRTVERALLLLAAVGEGTSTSLAAAAREAELSPSTALRLLRTLESNGFVRRDHEGNYRAGTRLLQLGANALSNESLVDYCQQEMAQLERETDESVYLAVPGHRETALYIAIVEGSHSVRHTNWVGRTIPLEGSANGRVLQGLTPDEGVVVVERGIEPDVTALASPVVAAGRVVGSISLLVPSYRMSPALVERYGRLLAESTARLSVGLAAG